MATVDELLHRVVQGRPDVDWLFFTDCSEPENHAPNAQYRRTSLADYCERVSRALEIEFLSLHFKNWKGDRWMPGTGPAAWTAQDTILRMGWRAAGRDSFRITPRGFEARNGTG